MTESKRGRPVTVSADDIVIAAFALFDEREFDEVTVDDIAQAAGVSRRTLFRYFPSKFDLVWGGLDEVLTQYGIEIEVLAKRHRENPDEGASTIDLIRQAYVNGLAVLPEVMALARPRLLLIAQNPNVEAYGMPRTSQTRVALAQFIAQIEGVHADGLRAQVLASSVSTAVSAALRWWAVYSDEPAHVIVDRALRELEAH